RVATIPILVPYKNPPSASPLDAASTPPRPPHLAPTQYPPTPHPQPPATHPQPEMPTSSSTAPRTRRARVPKPQPGSTRTNPVVLSSQTTDSQATTHSDSTTTSSHKQDSQEEDDEYDPAVGTPQVHSQGPTIGEELEELLNDANAADTDMVDHEEEAAINAATHGPADPNDEEMGDDTGEPAENTPMSAGQSTATLAGAELPSDTDDEDYAPDASAADTSATDTSQTSHRGGETISAAAAAVEEDLADYESSDDGYDHHSHKGPDEQTGDIDNEPLRTGNGVPTGNTSNSNADGGNTASPDDSQLSGLQLYGGEVETPLTLRTPSVDAITYAEVRDAAFGHSDRSKSALAPLVISYHIKHGFDYNNPNDLTRLRKDVRNLFLKKGGQAPPFVYYPPITSGRRAIHLLFSSVADFKLALDLHLAIWWRNKRIELDEHGPCIPHNTRLVTFQVPAQEEPEDVLPILEEQLHPQARLTHLWAHATGPENDPDLVERTGWMLAIIEIRDKHGAHVAGPLGATATALLPRWVQLRNTWYETSFADRPESCRNCRGDADDIHRTADCPFVYCNSCRTRHLDNACPKRRRLNAPKKDSDTKQPAPAPSHAQDDEPRLTPSPTGPAHPIAPTTNATTTSTIEVIPGRPISITGRAGASSGTTAPARAGKRTSPTARRDHTRHALPPKPVASIPSPPPATGSSWKPSSGPNAEPIGAARQRSKTQAAAGPADPTARHPGPPRSPKGKGREQDQPPIDFFFSPGRVADIARARGRP
ncbi:hypothetical protein OC842_006781, partial [Tilletia horrida]